MDIKIINVRRSYTGRNGWGYNEVELEDGSIVNLRQKPQMCWKAGDTVAASLLKRLKRIN